VREPIPLVRELGPGALLEKRLKAVCNEKLGWWERWLSFGVHTCRGPRTKSMFFSFLIFNVVVYFRCISVAAQYSQVNRIGLKNRRSAAKRPISLVVAMC
jgi:hypothetical protein